MHKKEYFGDDDKVLKATLVRLGILSDTDDLPRAYQAASGVAGKSRVYFLMIPGHDSDLQLVAKFDEEQRSKVEWDRIEEFQRLNFPVEGILPIPGNTRSDGVLVYQAGDGLSLTGKCSDLKGYFIRQLMIAPSNCVHAVSLAFSALSLFYANSPGAIRSAVDGKMLTWNDVFPKVTSQIERLRETAHSTWSDVDWSKAEFKLPSEEGVDYVFPNPLLGLKDHVDKPTGRVMLSRIHGDLNLTNLLVAEDAFRAPSQVFIIDLSHSRANAVTAMDFARIECEFWQEVYSGLFDADEQRSVSLLVYLRDLVDGRCDFPKESKPLENGVIRIIQSVRKTAARFLAGPTTSYLLEDYFYCLMWHCLAALSFPTVFNSRIRSRISIIGAALAFKTLKDIQAGHYSTGSTIELQSPYRDFSRHQPNETDSNERLHDLLADWVNEDREETE